MVGLDKIEAQLVALDQKWAVQKTAASIGIDLAADVTANKTARWRDRPLQALVKQHPDLPPEKLYEQWQTKVRATRALMRRMTRSLQMWGYEKAIGAARKDTPRLSPEGVKAAVAQLRHSVGSTICRRCRSRI